ncbi:hypothetical protein SPFL3102_01716 [Sporomusaceae bacterium FL31]|nr:hypothetical protein SPFL3101_03350 [Sporomusaceae bacterium FL31]GCE33907.1 hypothetical protein SPFL3102_01716 [Sporomusaceae bacterium]
MCKNLKIAIHSANDNDIDTFAPRWLERLEQKGIEVLVLDFRQQNIMNMIKQCDGAMWHWLHSPEDKQYAPKILQAINRLGIPTFPNVDTCWHYDEKVSQHYLFKAVDAPHIPSWVFWNYDEALIFIENCTYPIVFKLSVGAGSANVLKLDSYKEAKIIIDKIFLEGFFPYTLNEFAHKFQLKVRDVFSRNFLSRIVQAVKYIIFDDYPSIPGYFLIQKNYAYFQEFLPYNQYDIRVTVIGNRAFGFIRYNRPNDFRASGSGLIDYDIEKIPREAILIAHCISQKLGFQSMAYDFLLTSDGKPVINEISYCYVNTAVYNCPGYWDKDLVWHEGNIWPEYAHIDDFVMQIQSGDKI